jgi:hypothetical protein
VAAGGVAVTKSPASDAGSVPFRLAVPVLTDWSFPTTLACSGSHTLTSTFGATLPAVTRGEKRHSPPLGKPSSTGAPDGGDSEAALRK